MARTQPGGFMRRLTVLGITLGLAVGGLLAVGVPASAQTDAKAKATDIGVTPGEIRIAVVADVDNPFAPSLFQGDVNGVKAAVQHINSQGGVAGRKLKLDVIDSQLNPAKTRNAIITACQNDFALVGTSAAFMTDDRGRGQLQGPGREDDRAARLRGIRHRGAAVLAGGVPGESTATRLRDQG